MVGACGVSVGLLEFYKSRRNGSQVLLAQCCHNKYGRFLTLSEYGREVRCGFIAVPEGSKGEGWRWFANKLREVVSMYFASSLKNRASQRSTPCAHDVLGSNGTSVEVLMRSSLSSEANGCSVGRWEDRGMVGKIAVQPELNLPKKDVCFPKGDSTGVIDCPSLLAMQKFLLDMREKVESVLR